MCEISMSLRETNRMTVFFVVLKIEEKLYEILTTWRISEIYSLEREKITKTRVN